MDSAQTYQLYQTLSRLHSIASSGIPQGSRIYTVFEGEEFAGLDKHAAQIINAIHLHGEQLWEELEKLEPGVLDDLAIHQQTIQRARAVETFRAELRNQVWDESDWEEFFDRNEWIFGYGLALQFLSRFQPQANVGGTTLTGQGGQRTDGLMVTEAVVRYAALVEIKKPQTKLLGERRYRNKVYELGPDLIGGVSQLQSNCRTWIVEGSRQDENREILRQAGIETCEPKGILVIGNTEQLEGDINKRMTFELFRRNLHNPEIITYDELLSRAELLALPRQAGL